ncbi:hypothetical protein [Longirhabdus pacifica]|uniref:hypothetical protein n=1 Tax=Longirhabdus pacifica TaxID=2305227 RepID=UPI001008D805|nr:hypothetical protein [Longirhabdus pacifica]
MAITNKQRQALIKRIMKKVKITKKEPIKKITTLRPVRFNTDNISVHNIYQIAGSILVINGNGRNILEGPIHVGMRDLTIVISRSPRGLGQTIITNIAPGERARNIQVITLRPNSSRVFTPVCVPRPRKS